MACKYEQKIIPLLTAETGVLVTIMVVPLGVRIGLFEILVGSRTGIILLKK